MNSIDYFVKDSAILAEEQHNRARLLVIVLLSLIGITSALSLLSLFGIFNRLTNVSILLVLCFTLYIFKLKGNLDRTFFITTLLCSAFMIYNTATDGYVLSLNNKWFTIALITIFFIKPIWLKAYTYLLFALQSFYLYMSLGQGPDLLPIEEYVDNILLYGLCFALLNLLNKYQVSQNQLIRKSNKELEVKTILLSQSNQELEKFAYLASHDIKTPLRNIISFSMLLEKEVQKYSDKDKVLEYTNFIKNGSLKLDRLVTDVLSYSRMTASSEEAENVDLHVVIEEIICSIAQYLEDKNSQVIIENKMPILLAQKSMIHQLLKNIIENGIKYNDSDQPIVKLKFIDTLDHYCLELTDNGIGIPKQHHESIFKMFSRLHNEEQYEGTGIGLSTSKTIMDKLGGEIKLLSTEGQGTIFKLIFPESTIVKKPKA